MSRDIKNSGIEWIGEIPKNWDIRKYKNYCEVYAGGTPDTNNLTYWDGNIPWIQSGKIQNCDIFESSRNITKEGFLNSSTKYIPKNTPVLAMTGATCGNVGFLKIECCANQSVMAFVPKKQINLRYIYYSLMIQKDAILINQNGSAQSGINVENGKNLLFTVPPIEEQQIITNFLDDKVTEIDNIIDKTKLSIEEYKKYKQSIITESITKGLNPNVEMKDSGVEYIGKIPKNWKLRKLRYLGSLQNGISKSSDYFGYGYPFVSYSDVYKNIKLPSNGSGLIDSTEAERENYSVKQGDVFFTRTSETIEEVGFASTCLKTIKDAVFAGFVIRFRSFDNELYDNYSKYYFRSEIHRRFFVKEMNLVTRASLSQELLKKLPVLIPPNNEQQQISDYLDIKCSKIDNIISQKQQLIADLESYKKSLIYECVTGKREV